MMALFSIRCYGFYMEKKVVLKPGREKPIYNRHPWIFSGAVDKISSHDNGEILRVFSSQGKMLGYGYFNQNCSLMGRMVSFGSDDPYKTMENAFLQACGLRNFLFSASTTNAFRLINGEGDNLPGLVIDKYKNVLVMQIATLGMEKLKPFFVELMKKRIKDCDCIYEKSDMSCRKLEGMQDKEEIVFGAFDGKVEIVENNLRFLVDIIGGQKTGFFLDQREMRKMIGEYSHNRHVLNCFSYSGGFSIYGLRGGAKIADCVDSSKEALFFADKNFNLNGMDSKGDFYCEDVFSFLKLCESDKYDLIILDPPAFAKKSNDVERAIKGYRELNKAAIYKLKTPGMLLTCGCSYHVDNELFQRILFEVARELGKKMSILSLHRLALDHPISIFHPESEYLKSFLLSIS